MADERKDSMLPYMIADWAEREPNRKSLTFVEVGSQGEFIDETRTYGQLWENGQRVANALQQAGMQPNDRFAIMAQNHPEFVDSMVGSGIANTTFVPIDPRSQGQKLKFMLEFTECRGIVIGEYSVDALVAQLPELEHIEWVWVIGEGALPDGLPGGRMISDVLAQDLPDPLLPIAAKDPAEDMQMLFTSGTTGDPKAIIGPYQRFGNIAALAPVFGLTEDDVTYSGLSLTHANAQLITLGMDIKNGMHGVFSRKFTKSRLWDITREYGCTQFNLLGGMTTAIYSEPEKDNDTDNPVRMVISAGMPPAIWEKFEKRFGLRVYEFYGMAEGGVSMNPPDTGPIGSMGKPPETLVAKIFDESDEECAPGEVGELVFQHADGTCPPITYYKNAEKSASMKKNGWFRTGDMCHKDEDGWLYYDHRQGDAIRHNGDFVNPGFVQKEIAEHPNVDDVFVYGIKAATGVPGEKDVVAAVVLTGDCQPSDLFTHCRDRLEGNFVPSFIQVMDEIPKTASEKPQERFCIEALEGNPKSVYTEQR